MDPDATLRRILDAIAEGDPAELFHASGDLATWISKGGAVPDVRLVLADYLDKGLADAPDAEKPEEVWPW